MSKAVESPRPSILGELGLRLRFAGNDLFGDAEVTATMWVPGTSILRASVLAAWSDVIVGFLAAQQVQPQPTPVIELEVHLLREISGLGPLRAYGRVVKAGRSMVACAVDYTAEDGTRLAIARSLLLVNSTVRTSTPPAALTPETFACRRPTVPAPFAQRVGVERRAPGVASLACARHVLNPAHALNGGLLTVAVEEAALSADPDATALSSLSLQYLRPVRIGPAIARVDFRAGELCAVEVHDAATAELAVLATTRSFHA